MPNKQPNMIVEVTLRIPVDWEEWGGWRPAAVDVGDFISKILHPYFPQIKVRTDSDMDPDVIDEFLQEFR